MQEKNMGHICPIGRSGVNIGDSNIGIFITIQIRVCLEWVIFLIYL